MDDSLNAVSFADAASEKADATLVNKERATLAPERLRNYSLGRREADSRCCGTGIAG